MVQILPEDPNMFQSVMFKNPAVAGVAYFVTVIRHAPIADTGRGWDHSKPVRYIAYIERKEELTWKKVKTFTKNVKSGEDHGKIPLIMGELFLKAQQYLKDRGYELKDRRWKVV